MPPLDCSAPGGERCESLIGVDEIMTSHQSHLNDRTSIENLSKLINFKDAIVQAIVYNITMTS